jgi:hypothetical protein
MVLFGLWRLERHNPERLLRLAPEGDGRTKLWSAGAPRDCKVPGRFHDRAVALCTRPLAPKMVFLC